MRVEDKRRMNTTEMRMQRMLLSKTLKGKINNEKIREITEMKEIEKFFQEQRLRWLGHVERMEKERRFVKALNLTLEGPKKVDQKRDGRRW